MKPTDLSPAARAAADRQAIRGSWDGPALERLLQELLAYDVVLDARVAFRLKVMIGTIVAAVVGFIAAVVMIAEEDGLLLLAVAALEALLVGATVWRWLQASKMALPERALLMLQQMFLQIRQDLDPAEQIRVNVDLTGPTKAKRGQKQKLPAGAFLAREQYVFTDPWCSVRFQLRDGCRLTLRQVDQVMEVRRTKRSLRGKTKVKVRYKKLCRLTATLLPPAPVRWKARPQVDAEWERLRVANKKGQEVAVLERWFLYKPHEGRPKENPTGADAVGLMYRLCAMREVAAR
ncbi:MAG: hypothetical protein NTX13_10020 [Acidobacteria bacterium]|nr:hypothetical protein [Acidobacteriota bacterium]